MKITIKRQSAPQKFEEFIEQNKLEIEVVERDPENRYYTGSRFYAHIKDAYVVDGRMLSGAFENGSTPEEAIAALPRLYSGRRIKIANSYYIQCPEFQ